MMRININLLLAFMINCTIYAALVCVITWMITVVAKAVLV